MNFFSSDQHFGHEKIITPNMGRNCFATVEEHDNHLLERINSKVMKADTFYILGDFAWKNPQKWKGNIKCKNCVFIIGNHDRKEASKKAFGTVWDIRLIGSTQISDTRRKIVLCHYPMMYWPSSHHGAYHLYGHMHNQREKEMNEAFPERRSMDIGIDSAKFLLGDYDPFSEDEIMAYIGERKGHDLVEFYKNK